MWPIARIFLDQHLKSEIVSFTTINNLRSRSVMKKLGMLEDRMTFNHPNLPIGHALREHCLYRLHRDQWI
jgi:RimJ/RimL family protein N-acetyltransferase